MNSIDVTLTAPELEYILGCITNNLNYYSEVPEIAPPLIELLAGKLDTLKNDE